MNHERPMVIRRRRAEGEEEHHGGVWKLAFADFMTAMMAFFLVMWLINSTTKETKADIAQYFNPVQLVDASKARKGLRDPSETRDKKGASYEPPNDTYEVCAAKSAQENLQRTPLKALDEIATKEPPRAPKAQEGPRDPFDRTPESRSGAAETNSATPPGQAVRIPNGDPTASSDVEQPKSLRKLREEISRLTAKETRAPKIDVSQTEEGVLISLTDDVNFSMFAIGSVEPKPQLVRILAQIGSLLARKQGAVELRGHTDARLYAGGPYDNWRLSSDRAAMARYMLLRGGLPADRVSKIVGFADSRLKDKKDPLSPVNRRIDVLLAGEAP